MNAQQLKNSILQEAIEGRLVPQDPNDEPASVLLDKIRKEKARLVKERKIKTDKNESYIYRSEDGHWMEHFDDKKREDICIDDEIPFSIPNSWKWVRLRGLVSILGDGLHGTPEYDVKGKYYFINGNNLSNNKIVIKTNTEKVNEEEYIKYKKELNNKTILVSINGTIGNVGHYNGEPVILGKSACYYNLMDIRLKEYVTLLMYTDYFLKYAKDNATGSTIKNVSLAVMSSFFIPLPPLAEQHRIVAKIEELLPKVEEYGKAQEALDKLNEELPEKLKKSILQEAISGKLVPQDPNDEPASVLLDKIRKEKARLVKEGKLKKKDLEETPISEDEIPFEIPVSWEWINLSLVTSLIDGEKKEGDYVCLDAKFLRGKSSGEILKKGKFVKVNDNIILVDGENSGEVFTVPCDGYMGSTFKQLWVSSQMCLPYVLFFIKTYKDILRNSKKGAAIPHLNKEIFNNLKMGLPPLAEQHRIVAKIEQLMKEIDKLKK